MKILLITHYFPPEIGAPSARLFEMGKHWVKLGHEVTVLTGFPNHPTGVIPEEYRGFKFLEEKKEGIRILRNYVYATPNEGFVKKTIGHISFMLSSIIQSYRKVKDIDVIVVSSPTFFSIFSAYFYSILKRRPLVIDIRDLWPAAIVELGVLKNKLIIKTLEMLEMFFYKKSARITVVTNSFKEILIKRKVPQNKIEVITNGVETSVYKQLPMEREKFRIEYGYKDEFIVLYIGAHGISQALSKIIDVAKSLQHEKKIIFLFVGEGAEKVLLMDRVKKEGIVNVRFISAQSKEQIPSFYALADVCLVPLRNIPLFNTFIPSKMFEIMSAEKPIIASLAGESAEILEDSGAAIVVPPEDVSGIRKGIIKLKSDINLRLEMGKKGRRFVEDNYSRERLAFKFGRVLEDAVRERKK